MAFFIFSSSTALLTSIVWFFKSDNSSYLLSFKATTTILVVWVLAPEILSNTELPLAIYNEPIKSTTLNNKLTTFPTIFFTDFSFSEGFIKKNVPTHNNKTTAIIIKVYFIGNAPSLKNNATSTNEAIIWIAIITFQDVIFWIILSVLLAFLAILSLFSLIVTILAYSCVLFKNLSISPNIS